MIDGYITDKEKIKAVINEHIEYDEYVEWIELFGSDTMTVSGLDQIVSHMMTDRKGGGAYDCEMTLCPNTRQ